MSRVRPAVSDSPTRLALTLPKAAALRMPPTEPGLGRDLAGNAGAGSDPVRTGVCGYASEASIELA